MKSVIMKVKSFEIVLERLRFGISPAAALEEQLKQVLEKLRNCIWLGHI